MLERLLDGKDISAADDRTSAQAHIRQGNFIMMACISR